MDPEASLSSALNESVALLPYDPAWPGQFEAERTRLLDAFPGAFLAIEHFGSTAVPGLRAKPIIDILAGVESMARADALLDPLCECRYTTSEAFNAGLVGRRWLMRFSRGRRTHHLHLVVHGSLQWRRRIRFRDALRADPGVAGEYQTLKEHLAEKFRADREAYSTAKDDFIDRVLRDVGF